MLSVAMHLYAFHVFLARIFVINRRSTDYAPLFSPVSTTPFNSIYGWAIGRLPEFLDSKFASKHTGREVTRVQSNGSAKIRLNTVTKDFENCGYKSNKC